MGVALKLEPDVSISENQLILTDLEVARTALVKERARLLNRSHVQVNPVQQRATQLALVAADLVRRAATGPCGAAQITAGAGVHGRDQLKAGREFSPTRGAGDGDAARLQRFAQGFERCTRKLGQFVQKQHAVMRQ